MPENDKNYHSCNIIPGVKKALNLAIKRCPFSRIQIADRMNELLEEEGSECRITAEIINSWTKDDPARVIPLKLLPYFCKVTDSILPFAALVGSVGARVIQGSEIDVLELGFAELERLRVKQRKSSAMGRLGILEEEPGARDKG